MTQQNTQYEVINYAICMHDTNSISRGRLVAEQGERPRPRGEERPRRC